MFLQKKEVFLEKKRSTVSNPIFTMYLVAHGSISLKQA